MGMLATVMNGIALRDSLERNGIKTRVMSAIPMPCIVEHYDRRRAIHLLDEGLHLINVLHAFYHSAQQYKALVLQTLL